MKPNLDTLKEEMLAALRGEGFVVFYGYSRLGEAASYVTWDTHRHPDFREFLAVARDSGVKLMVYHEEVFSQENFQDALDRVEVADLPESERRALARRVREFEPYEGFTCLLELSFDCQGRVYVFHLCADWYDDFRILLEEIDAMAEEEPEEGDSMGGYYTRN